MSFDPYVFDQSIFDCGLVRPNMAYRIKRRRKAYSGRRGRVGI